VYATSEHLLSKFKKWLLKATFERKVSDVS